MRGDDMQTISDLIDRFSLHPADAPLEPVNLAPLDPWFRMQTAPADAPRLAWALPPLGGLIATATPAHIFVRADLDDDAARLCYAHEVAHLALGHQGSAPLATIAPVLHDKAERTAWQGAALLLIPSDALVSGWPPAKIAASLHVPAWLVDAHPFAGMVSAFTAADAR